MKKLIFTLFLLNALTIGTYAQYCGNSGSTLCTPDGSLTKPGLGPTSDSLPSVVNGVVSTTIIQFRNYDTARYQGNLVTVQKLRIDSIGNLPVGLCWATDHANNTYNNQEEGCIRVSGTTCSDPGVYKLFIRVGVDIGLGVFIPVNAEEVGLKYYVRVINSGDGEVPLDTSQSAPFVKQPGYSASATNCTVGIDDIGSVQSTLNVVPNPFSNKAVVSFFSDQTITLKERITNMIGSEVQSREVEAKAGENSFILDRNTLPVGVYFYSLSDGKNIVTKRLVISE